PTPHISTLSLHDALPISRRRSPVPPTVSVILPTYSRLELLPRAIDSVLAQTFSGLEVVVVDDGPSGAIADFVGGHPDERVRLVRSEEHTSELQSLAYLVC